MIVRLVPFFSRAAKTQPGSPLGKICALIETKHGYATLTPSVLNFVTVHN
jgi:hypothetical protein